MVIYVWFQQWVCLYCLGYHLAKINIPAGFGMDTDQVLVRDSVGIPDVDERLLYAVV